MLWAAENAQCKYFYIALVLEMISEVSLLVLDFLPLDAKCTDGHVTNC